GDVAHLPGEVAGHEIHAVGQVGPSAGDPLDLRLPAELALGAHLARHARDLGSEAVQLIDHRVDGVLELEDFAADSDGDLLRKLSLTRRSSDLGDVAHLPGEVAGHQIHAVGQVGPSAGDPLDLRLPAELALGTHFARDARHFGGEAVQLVDHRVDGVLQLEN